MQQVDEPYQPITSSVTQKGQITIPAHIRSMLHVQPKDKIAFLVSRGTVAITPVRSVTDRTAGMLQSPIPGLSATDERAAIEEAWAAEAEPHGR